MDREKMTHQALADALGERQIGCNRSTVSYWLSGRNRPDKPALLALADLFRLRGNARAAFYDSACAP